MQTKVKNVISRRLMPIVKKVYWRLFVSSARGGFPKKNFVRGELTVLNCEVSYNKYGGYCVPISSRHRPEAQRILYNDVFERKTIEYILENCKDGDVVHAGTYFGDFLPALAKGVVAGAKIWAFEPNLENYRCARITLEINGIENTSLINAGLGCRKETLLLRTTSIKGRALGGLSQIVPDKSINDTGIVPVKIVTIDDEIDSGRNISIIQLDIEGHEKEALEGALNTIRRCLPILILEDLPHSTFLESDWFNGNILSLGYKKVKDIRPNSVFSI